MISDWELEQLREDSARAAARVPSTAPQLFAAESATPTSEQRAVLHDCVRRTRADGLELPIVNVVWKHGPHGVCDGAVRRNNDGEIVVALSVHALDLTQTCFHELKHCADFDSGTDLSREELEVRAVRYANRMIRNQER